MGFIKYVFGIYCVILSWHIHAGIPDILKVNNLLQNQNFKINFKQKKDFQDTTSLSNFFQAAFATKIKKQVLHLAQGSYSWEIEYYLLPDQEDYCQVSVKYKNTSSDVIPLEDVAIKKRDEHDRFFLLLLKAEYADNDTLIQVCEN